VRPLLDEPPALTALSRAPRAADGEACVTPFATWREDYLDSRPAHRRIGCAVGLLARGLAVLSAGRGICMTGRSRLWFGARPTAHDVRKAVREQLKEGADSSRFFATGAHDTRRRTGSPQLTEAGIRAAIEEARKAGAGWRPRPGGVRGSAPAGRGASPRSSTAASSIRPRRAHEARPAHLVPTLIVPSHRGRGEAAGIPRHGRKREPPGRHAGLRASPFAAGADRGGTDRARRSTPHRQHARAEVHDPVRSVPMDAFRARPRPRRRRSASSASRRCGSGLRRDLGRGGDPLAHDALPRVRLGSPTANRSSTARRRRRGYPRATARAQPGARATERSRRRGGSRSRHGKSWPLRPRRPANRNDRAPTAPERRRAVSRPRERAGTRGAQAAYFAECANFGCR